jgi:RHS repeat-associated protein
MKVHSGKINNTKFSMDRAFIAFDTAEIPDNVAISEVKLKVYVESKLNHDNDGDDWVTVVQGLQPSATSLAKADYDLAGSINFPEEGVDNSQRKDITNTAVNAFMEFSLNNTGRSWVSKTGVSKFAMREGHDVLDRPFVGSSGQYNQLVVRTGEFSGTTSDPILEVTYIDTPLAPTVIQDANYSYDNNGNILRIIEAQGTDSAKTTNYVYDDLNRLTHAVISGAVNGSNVGRSYTYDAIGNILSSSDQGVYTYAGSGLVNPHAVTRAGLVNYTYDNNGNLLSDGIWTHSWDYNNRIKQSAKTGLVVNYGYGVDGQRVRQTNGTTSTNYPTKLYNTEGGSAQKHIFANGSTIATVKGSNGSAVVYINHTDHLSGTSAMSNSTGALVQVLDYHPFGEMRLDWRFSSSFDEQRKFTGYELDRDTGLNYASARYYNAIIGRFISQDPVFLALGNSELVKSLTGSQLQSVLLDPQNLNAYAYARNNPIINTDPTGLFSLNPINLFSYNTQITIGSWANNAYTNNSLARYALDHPYQAGIAIGFVGGAAVSIGVMAGGGTITCGILCGGGATVTVATGGAALSTQANRAVGLLNNAQSTLLTAAQRQTVAGSIQNPTLRNIFNSLYQGNDKLPGGTAGAIRYEQATGNLLSPAGHLQKGQTTMNGLNKLLNNPNVSQGDKGLASMLRDQLSNAIKGK